MGPLWLMLALGGACGALSVDGGGAPDLARRQACVLVGTSGSAGLAPCPTTSVDSAGQTIISNANGAVTIPTGATAPITATFSDETTTIDPSTLAIVTVNSAGQTIVSGATTAVTLPESVSTTLVTELPNGETATISPETTTQVSDGPATTISNSQTSSSSGSGALIVPITTSVDKPTPTPGGAIVPCDYLWFFDLCLNWQDEAIGGWQIPLKPGVHPP